MKLMQGDCLELMKSIPDKSIDMVLCDLPYGTTGSKWDRVISPEALWGEYRRILKDSGTVLLFATEPFATAMRFPALDLYKYDWIWLKRTVTGFAHSKNMPLRNYENIMCFSKGAVAHKGRSLNRMTYNPQGLEQCEQVDKCHKVSLVMHSGTFKNSESETYVRTQTGYPKMALEFGKVQSDSAFHLNAKPVALLEYLIQTYTNDGETVLDNTMGSGSTGVACVNTGRDFIGIELDPGYFKTAQERIEEAVAHADP